MNHKQKTMALLRKGWTTALSSAQAGGCMSLAQRVSEWRADGVMVLDKWVQTEGGARIKAYRIISPTKWTA